MQAAEYPVKVPISRALSAPLICVSMVSSLPCTGPHIMRG